MGRNKHCSEEERTIIERLRAEGKTIREIAKVLNRSPNMITNALKPRKHFQKRGRPRKTTPHMDRCIAAEAK